MFAVSLVLLASIGYTTEDITAVSSLKSSLYYSSQAVVMPASLAMESSVLLLFSLEFSFINPSPLLCRLGVELEDSPTCLEASFLLP